MAEIELKSDIDVSLVEHMGSDKRIAQAARVSTIGDAAEDTGLTSEKIEGLLRFLMEKRHGTPFEHNSMTFLIRAPIFVFREFHRHRVGWSYNEESARYRKMRPVFWIPRRERKLVQQGKPGAYTFAEGDAAQHGILVERLSASYKTAWDTYESNLEANVAKEVARACLPVGVYSAQYATCNTRSLMHFLGLRTQDERAKFPSTPMAEIEEAARGMESHFAKLFPVTHEMFNRFGRVSP